MVQMTALEARSSPSPLGIVLSLSTPRLFDGRPRQAGLLACGLRSRYRLPGSLDPVAYGYGAHRLQLRGQPGLEPEFPLNPGEGNLPRADKLPQKSCAVNPYPGIDCPSSRCAPCPRGGTL